VNDAFGELLAMMDSEEIDYWLRRSLDSGHKRLAEILDDELKERQQQYGPMPAGGVEPPGHSGKS
jgi:hypothetical protein